MSGEGETAQKVLDGWLKRFDVRSYDVAREFGVKEWSFVLSRRRHVFDMHEYRDTLDEIECAKQVVLETPLLTRGLREDSGGGGRSVESLNCYSAWCMRDSVEMSKDLAEMCRLEGEGPSPFVSVHEKNSPEWWDDLIKEVRSRESEDTAKSQMLFASYHDLLVQHGCENNYAYAEINLSAPDELILSDFKEWLASMRNDRRFDHSPVNRFTEKELARWVSNRVLPYIDLMLLHRALNVTLTNNFAGAILFDNRDFDPAEKIRKTVAPMARELLNYEMLEALKMASGEVRRKKNNG